MQTDTRLEIQPDNARYSVLLVDDHDLVAETIAAFVNAQPDIRIDVCSDITSALESIRDADGYDVVLLDYNLPGSDGLSGLSRVIDANNGRVAVFSGVASHSVVERALELGAAGYVPKTLSLRSLLSALRFMAEGEKYVPSEFINRSLHHAETQKSDLKPIEQKVLVHLCEGLQNKEISRLLGLSEVSVKGHVKSICGKLGAKNRTQAVIIATQRAMC